MKREYYIRCSNTKTIFVRVTNNEEDEWVIISKDNTSGTYSICCGNQTYFPIKTCGHIRITSKCYGHIINLTKRINQWLAKNNLQDYKGTPIIRLFAYNGRLINGNVRIMVKNEKYFHLDVSNKQSKNFEELNSQNSKFVEKMYGLLPQIIETSYNKYQKLNIKKQ